MDLSNYATVLPIVIICYLIGYGCKVIKHVPNKYIPIIVGVAGGILAIPAVKIMPDCPATDVITAISIGIMSGLTSTGVNQVFKVVKAK